MRSKIYLYLFLFTLLILIFQLVNAKKMLDAKDEEIEDLKQELTVGKMATDSLLNQNLDLQYFSLLKNDKAMTYLENKGYNAQEIANAIEAAIIDKNSASADNPLVPFAGMNGTMRINKTKILNHKWIIADFTDGTYWGEIFLSYEFDENDNLHFNTEKSFLYPVN